MNFNNKILATIFFVLLAIYVIKNVISKPATRSFRSTLVQVDTSMVDRIIMYPKGIDSISIDINASGQGWTASNGTLTVNAASNRVNSILGQLVNIPTQRLISKSSDKFVDYEVDEKSGKLVELYSKGELVEKIVFGRFNFNSNTRAATSYARLYDEEEIYSIDGFMSMSFDTDFNSFRDRSIINLNQDDIKAIRYVGQGEEIFLSQNAEGKWASSTGTLLDSVSMVNYLNGISNLSGRDFADGFTPSSPATQALEITADNTIGALRIDCFKSNGNFIIKSATNNAFFSSDSAGIFKNLFTDVLPLAIN